MELPMPRPLPPLRNSEHAQGRLDSRRISREAVHAALTWGRRCWSHGDQVYRLDRRSVLRARAAGQRVEEHEGVTVVLTSDGTIRSVWRNRQPKRIRR